MQLTSTVYPRNTFVDDNPPDISELSDCPSNDEMPVQTGILVEGPYGDNRNKIESEQKVKNDNVSPESQVDVALAKKSTQNCSTTKAKNEFCSNARKPTMDISDEDEKSDEIKSAKSEYTPNSKGSRKRKRRRDVIFKTILRECRRFFQIQLSNVTGFITSKKPRNDDYMYSCMKRFNEEALGKQGTFEENFYLACLLYPQDLIRNMDSFVEKKGVSDFDTARKELKQDCQKIHDTLYKYSHDKLDFFVSKPELSFLFCYFYEKGAGAEREDPKFSEEYEFIRSKCMDTLNRKL